VTPDGRPRKPLPADRAFVVQLRADSDLGRGAISGRIEHVSSGSAALFDSVEVLLEFIRGTIGQAPEPAEPSGNGARRAK
jgi:hypothetical protein